MADETQEEVKEAVEEAKGAVSDAVDAAVGAEAAADKAENAAEAADSKQAEKAAEAASEAASEAADAAKEAKESVEKVEDAVEEHIEADKVVPAKFKDMVKSIENMTVLELAELVKVLEDKFGVSAAPVAVAGAAAAGGEAGPAAEEKSAYTVVLKSSGDKKIEVIKAIRELTQKGLADSKALADGAPANILENVKKEEADEAKTKLEAAGATVELQ